MKIDRIKVHAARCFNHPYEQYSNLRPEVTLEATLDPGEDPFAATKALQSRAETLVEDHKQAMLKSLEELFHMSQATAEISALGDQIHRAQDRLSELRKKHPQLTLTLPEEI